MDGRVPRTQRLRVRPVEGWAPPGCTLPKTHHAMTTHNHTIPDQSPPRSTRTAPSAGHQDGGVKCATGASSKIRGRDNITIGTWNTRTLRAAGKLQELTHEMDRYRWNILGLCEMRWKNTALSCTTTKPMEIHQYWTAPRQTQRKTTPFFYLYHKQLNKFTNTFCRAQPAGPALLRPCKQIVIETIIVPVCKTKGGTEESEGG